MVIELSGVQFGLKLYTWFEITSMISDQNCTTHGSITTLLHPFRNNPNTGLGKFKKQKMAPFVNKSHQSEPIRLQGPPVISKWV